MFSIYKIDCGDECYIGSTKNFTKREYDHRDRAKTDKYKDYLLYKKMNETSPTFTVLENIECDKTEIRIHEQRYIDLLKPTLNMRDAVRSREKERERNKLRMRRERTKMTQEEIDEINKKRREKRKKNKIST